MRANADGPVLRSTPTRTLATLSLAGLTYALLQSLVSPALTTMQHGLGTSEVGITWVLTAYLLASSVTTPVIGRLGDIHGKRRMLAVSLTGLAVGTAIAALATNVETMVAGRVIQGLGGGVFPLAYGIIRDEFPSERVGGAIGFVSALFGLGAGFGVVLSGVIIQALNYHWLFWFPCVAALLAIAGTLLLVPESRDRAPGRINWPAAALMGLGLTAVLLAVSQTSTWGWGSAKTLALIAAGLVVLAGWVTLERRSRNPLVDMHVMAVRGVWTTNLLAVSFGVSMFVAFALIPRFAQTPSDSAGYGFGASVTGAGAFLLPLSLVMLLVGTVAGRVEARIGSKASAAIGTAFSLLAFCVLLGAHEREWQVLLASALLGVGAGLALAAMANLIVQAVPPSQTGVASGINAVSRSIGSAFGGQVGATFLAGSVVAGLPAIGGYNDAFLMAIVTLCLAFVAIAAHPGRSPSRLSRPVEPRTLTAEPGR